VLGNADRTTVDRRALGQVREVDTYRRRMTSQYLARAATRWETVFSIIGLTAAVLGLFNGIQAYRRLDDFGPEVDDGVKIAEALNAVAPWAIVAGLMMLGAFAAGVAELLTWSDGNDDAE